MEIEVISHKKVWSKKGSLPVLCLHQEPFYAKPFVTYHFDLHNNIYVYPNNLPISRAGPRLKKFAH